MQKIEYKIMKRVVDDLWIAKVTGLTDLTQVKEQLTPLFDGSDNWRIVKIEKDIFKPSAVGLLPEEQKC